MTAKPKVTKQTRRRSSTARIVWRDVTAKVRHTRDYLLDGQDHVEVMVVAPAGAVLPITETGYRSHFLPAEELATAGAPCASFSTGSIGRPGRGDGRPPSSAGGSSTCSGSYQIAKAGCRRRCGRLLVLALWLAP